MSNHFRVGRPRVDLYWPAWDFALDTIFKVSDKLPYDLMVEVLADHFNPLDPTESLIEVLLDERLEKYLDPMQTALFVLKQWLPEVPESEIVETVKKVRDKNNLRQTINRAYGELSF